MIESKRLLAIADELVGRTKIGAPNQTALRRGISTAYYALFHHIIGSTADTLVGKKHRRTPRYALIYRSFDHRRMREVCEMLDKQALGNKARAALGIQVPTQDMRDIATIFANLQQRRHWSDYNPVGKVSRSDAKDLIDQAELAMNKFTSLPLETRKNLMVFLMTSSRE